MEEFKTLEKLTEIDERHLLEAQITGGVLSLKKLHAALSQVTLNDCAPEAVRSQFNVARNMAVYTYFCYSLAPEVHMKTFSVMEMALRIFYGGDEKTNLKALVGRAVEQGCLTDSGFRVANDDPENSYCKELVSIFPKLRNSLAHGSSMLVPNSVEPVEICADFINQLFPAQPIPV